MAVVKHRPQGLAFLLLLFPLSFHSLSAQSGKTASAEPKGGEQREGALDMVLLLDKSLSMAPFFDKAKAVRAIRAVRANGRFTDLGAALDAAKRDLDELGKPERPKYVVLISDERQEAPKGSPYQAPDYKLKHPSLEYVKKVDLGKFRAITVGLQVGTKVSETAPVVMQLLLDPPVRAGTADGTVAGSEAADASGGTGAALGGGVTQSERALPTWLFYVAALILLLALAGLAAALLVLNRRKEEKVERTE